MTQEKEYFAFISYQRKDEEWADRLRNKLEHYRLPSSVRKQDASLPKEIRPIFRDALELAGGVLAKEIEIALQNSKYLIVICSPNSAKSPWVNKEIQTFIDLSREDRIIPFIIDGTPFSDNADTECFPPALRSLKGEKELLGININELSRDAASIKVVARMFGLKFDTLWQRYEREKKRKRWMVVGGALLFALVSLGIGTYIAYQNRELDAKNKEVVAERDKANLERNRANSERNRAESANASLLIANDSIKHQYTLIEKQKNEIAVERDNVVNAIHGKNVNQSRYIAKVAMSLVDGGDSYLARVLSEHILRHYPYTSEAEDALMKACSKENALLRGHSRRIIFASFLPKGKTIISVSNDNTIRLWDASTGACQEIIPFDSKECRVASISHDGTKLALGVGNRLYVWNIKSREIIKKIDVNTPLLLDCSFSPNDKEIVYVIAEKKVYIWNIENDKSYSLTNEHDSNVNRVQMTPDGEKVVCVSYDDSIKYYNISNRNNISKEIVPIKGRLAIPCSDNKKMIIADGQNLILYNYVNKQLEETMKGHTSRVYNVSLSSDGQYVVSSSLNEVILWEISSGKLLQKIEERGYSASISQDNRKMFFLSEDYDIHLVGIGNDVIRQSFHAPTQFNAVACSPSGRNIASASDDGRIRIWDAENGTVKLILEGHTNRVKDVVYSPDGQRIASASDKTIHVWDVQTGRQIIKPLERHTLVINAISFSSDGKRLASASWDGTVRIWDIEKGKCKTFPSNTIYYDICYSPDGQHYATADGNGLVKIWDIEGNCVKTLEGDELWTISVSYNPDGRIIASTSRDGTIRLWNANTGECLRVLRGHTDSATSAIFSKDGKYIISTSYDNTIKIWRVETGNCLQTLLGHESNVMASALTSDGHHIVSASWDGSIKLWDFPPLQQLIDETRERFKNRQLTPEERRKYYLE